MNNHIKFFVESVSKLGIAKPECTALTDLAKACLESALSDDYDEDNPEYDDDFNIIDGKEENDDIESMPDPDTDFDTLTRGEERDNIEMDRYNQTWEDVYNTPHEEIHESIVGTKLAKTYIQVAPKLIDSGKCSPSDMDNLSNFIDWMINEFNKFKPKEYVAAKYTNDSYDASRLDKILSVVDVGPAVVQLLDVIKENFQTELDSASFTNEKGIFSVAKDINFFVGDMFNNFADDAELDAEQEDTSIGFNDEGGFIDDAKIATRIDAQDGEEIEDEPTNTNGGTPTEDKPSGFPENSTLEEVEKAVNDFIEFIPTIGLTDSEATELTTIVDEKKKDNAREIAKQRNKFKSEHKGDVRETGNMPDNPWGDMF